MEEREYRFRESSWVTKTSMWYEQFVPIFSRALRGRRHRWKKKRVLSLPPPLCYLIPSDKVRKRNKRALYDVVYMEKWSMANERGEENQTIKRTGYRPIGKFGYLTVGNFHFNQLFRTIFFSIFNLLTSLEKLN